MWFKRKSKNRRLTQVRVLEVKLRSTQVRMARVRLFTIALGVSLGTIFGLYLLWRGGEWGLDRLVYENKSFAIQQIDVATDGVIAPDQIRRWSGVKPGANLLALDLARVKRDLELSPVVRSAFVERVLPNTLRIRIAEREPVAQINLPRPRAGGGIELVVFQIDEEGCVMLPLDPRQRAIPLNQAEDDLPSISGIGVADLQPGRKVESIPVRAALQLLAAFESSPLAGLVDLKRIDASSREVLVVTTAQGSEITMALGNFDQQLRRWQAIQEWGLKMNKVIGTLDLAVPNNVPARWLEASAVPPSTPHPVKPQRTRKRNV